MSAHRNIQLKSRRFGACLMVFFGLGCAPADRPSEQVELLEVAPEPAVPPRFAVLGWGEAQAVQPAVYRGAGRYSQHGFLTMERTLFDSIDASWELELLPEGRARACLAGTRRHGGSVSHYASKDGKDHHNEYTSDWFVCMTGRWAAQDAADTEVWVRFERASHFDREVTKDAYDLDEASTWQCFGLNEKRHGLGSTLACRLTLPGRPHGVEKGALALAGTPRDGSWEMREDITRRGEPTFSEAARPWLVFGEGGGIRVESSDDGRGRGRDGVELSFETASLDAVVKPAAVAKRL